ncbi:S1/P1 nuclease [uncultured Eudoraea sp.]|uniref:S1/P1 nuclease n=1 Tax=uncultured Eudoraea sp. TaxID=1035614 RepID=UPI00262AF0BD|nr:S1/P1 nuclease [uncultured Eudoraea sp.]
MRSIVLLCLLSAHLVMGNSNFWSKTGHRVVGEVAMGHLNRKTNREVSKLLNGQSLAAVSNYADIIKSDRAFKNFSTWHYVNIPLDKNYSEVEPSPNGDLVTGIQKCIEILKNQNSTEADRIFYLKMLIHLIGDLHQPMHVGRAEDKGGNDIQLQWFGKGSNLHRVWDSNMINDYGMSYTELSKKLPVLDKEQIREIKKGTVLEWVKESQELVNEIYSSVGKGEKLGYSYSYKYWNTVEKQLQKGGLRLAQVLNDIFS